MLNDHNEFFSHFPTKTSNALVEYVKETALRSSRYLFVWRQGKAQMAYCTHCHDEYQIGVGKTYFKHNEKTACLHCSSECVVKSDGRGRSKLIDDVYVVWYEKSVVNPNAVVARWLHVLRDYRGDYRKTETQFATCALYLFEYGRGGRMLRLDWNGEWHKTKNVSSLSVGTYWYPKAVYCSTDNVEKAVSGTPFQYSMWQEYEKESYDFLRFFDTAAKYPSVEYLTKLGLRKLVSAKLLGHKTYGAIYWRGKSIDKVLRISKAEVRNLRKIANEIEPKSLYSYHFWHKLGWTISPSDAHYLRGITEGYYLDMLKEICEAHNATLPNGVRYLIKQMRRLDAPATYSRVTYVLTEWKDYMRDCIELGIDIKQDYFLYPSNLHIAHDKTMRKIMLKRDEKINELIEAKLPGLEIFTFTSGEYLIRPAKSSLELFNEGKALCHCVGGYADRYAKGETEIFLVRQASNPDIPFCTVEVTEGKIQQARGYKNSVPKEDIQTFLKAFVNNIRLVKKRLKKKMAA